MKVNFEDLPRVRRDHAEDIIVFSGGCFDIFHEGHVAALERRRRMGDLLVVGVVSDQRVAQRKGPDRPIRSQAGRLAVVNALRCVDYSFIMPMPTQNALPTIQVIESLQPDIFTDGSEHVARWEESRQHIEELGTKLVIDMSPRENSSTDIVNAILASTHSSNYQ